MFSTQLTSADGYDVNNIIFSKPEIGTIPGSVPKLSFKRIRIGTKNQDNSTGDLIIETPPDLFSFGLQENRELGSGNVNGYVMPMCLWNKNGATSEEKHFTEIFEQIVNKCKQHLLDSKDEIERYDLDMSDLKNFNPLYWKKEKGKIVDGKGPVLYIKTLMSKKNEKISTFFINEETNEEMNPFDVLNKYCFLKGAIKIESIFIGNKISLQLKLYEAVIKPIDMERKTLLRTNVVRKVDTTSSDIFEAMNDTSIENDSNPSMINVSPPSPKGSLKDDEDDDEDDESDESESETESSQVPVTPPISTPITTPPTIAKKPVARKTRVTTK
jgi:hypothetical protein